MLRLIKLLLLSALAAGAVALPARAFDFPTPLAYEAGGINIADYVARPHSNGIPIYWNGSAFVTEEDKTAAPPQWFQQGFGNTPIAGVLVDSRADKNALVRILNHPEVIDEGWKTIRFIAYDLPDDSREWSERQTQLKDIVDSANSSYLELITWQTFASDSELQAALDAMYTRGGSGYVLRHRDSRYAARDKPLYLALPYEVAVATVQSHITGKGEYVGMMGSLEVVDEQGSEFLIASGFRLHERRNPPAVGSRIAFRYKDYTSTGKPKRPVFLRVLPPAHKKIGGIIGTHLLTWIFILMMIMLAALDAYSHAVAHRRRINNTNTATNNNTTARRWNFKSAIVSIGLLGTFVGIWWGLYNFDASQIRSSVPILLDGLKFSFITSIFGIALSTALSIAQTLLGHDYGNEQR